VRVLNFVIRHFECRWCVLYATLFETHLKVPTTCSGPNGHYQLLTHVFWWNCRAHILSLVLILAVLYTLVYSFVMGRCSCAVCVSLWGADCRWRWMNSSVLELILNSSLTPIKRASPLSERLAGTAWEPSNRKYCFLDPHYRSVERPPGGLKYRSGRRRFPTGNRTRIQVAIPTELFRLLTYRKHGTVAISSRLLEWAWEITPNKAIGSNKYKHTCPF
jgi:hypothetical protein